MTDVLDASAILAFVVGEDGADLVERALATGACVGAANWSEVAQKVIQSGRDWDLVRALLLAYELEVVPVSAQDAEWAAHRWRKGEGLSLGDRLCLALAHARTLRFLTADQAWGTDAPVHQIR